jgi:hypothetical protein
LVYVLDNSSAPNAAWIVKAVEAVIGEPKNQFARSSKSSVKTNYFPWVPPPTTSVFSALEKLAGTPNALVWYHNPSEENAHHKNQWFEYI